MSEIDVTLNVTGDRQAQRRLNAVQNATNGVGNSMDTASGSTTDMRASFANLGNELAGNTSIGRVTQSLSGMGFGLNASTLAISALAVSVVAAGAVLVKFTSIMVEYQKSAFETALSIQRVSDATDVTTDSISRLQTMVSKGGGTFEDTADLINDFAVKLGDARDGNEGFRETFTSLGVDLSGPIDAALNQTLISLGKIENKQDAAFKGDEIFADKYKIIAQQVANGSKLLEQSPLFSNRYIGLVDNMSKKFNELKTIMMTSINVGLEPYLLALDTLMAGFDAEDATTWGENIVTAFDIVLDTALILGEGVEKVFAGIRVGASAAATVWSTLNEIKLKGDIFTSKDKLKSPFISEEDMVEETAKLADLEEQLILVQEATELLADETISGASSISDITEKYDGYRDILADAKAELAAIIAAQTKVGGTVKDLNDVFEVQDTLLIKLISDYDLANQTLNKYRLGAILFANGMSSVNQTLFDAKSSNGEATTFIKLGALATNDYTLSILKLNDELELNEQQIQSVGNNSRDLQIEQEQLLNVQKLLNDKTGDLTVSETTLLNATNNRLRSVKLQIENGYKQTAQLNIQKGSLDRLALAFEGLGGGARQTVINDFLRSIVTDMDELGISTDRVTTSLVSIGEGENSASLFKKMTGFDAPEDFEAQLTEMLNKYQGLMSEFGTTIANEQVATAMVNQQRILAVQENTFANRLAMLDSQNAEDNARLREQHKIRLALVLGNVAEEEKLKAEFLLESAILEVVHQQQKQNIEIEQLKAVKEQKLEIALQFAEESIGIFNSVADAQANADQRALDSYKKSEQDKIDALVGSSRAKQALIDKVDAEVEKREKENAERAGKMQIASIAANTAVGIAGAWGNDVKNFGTAGLITASITSAALIANAVIQSNAVRESYASFATGGIVGGSNGASMGPDNTMANVRTGEAIMTANMQRELLEIARGNGNGGLTIKIENFTGSEDEVDKLEANLQKLQSYGRTNVDIVS
jgi:hypothetical protein